jgi:hypothetical protein
MRNKRVSVLAVLFGMAAPLICHSSTMLSAAHVLAVGTYGNGNIYITLDQPLDQVGCATPYIELAANGAANKTVLAVATIAMTTGSPVTVETDGCLSSMTATFTGGRNGTAFGLSKP